MIALEETGIIFFFKRDFRFSGSFAGRRRRQYLNEAKIADK